MKRLILLLLISFVAFGINAQEIERPSSSTYNTFSRNPLMGSYSYWDYTGTSSDLLIPTTSDTIDIRFHTKKYAPYTVKVISKFSPILGADTIVYINLLGRNSEDETWTSILSDSSAVVITDNVKKTISSATSPTYTATIAAYTMLTDTTGLSGYPADSIQVPSQTITLAETSTLLEYRYLLVRYILPGDDSVGTGVELDRCELKLNLH